MGQPQRSVCLVNGSSGKVQQITWLKEQRAEVVNQSALYCRKVNVSFQVKQPELYPLRTWDAGATDGSFTHYTTMHASPSPFSFFLNTLSCWCLAMFPSIPTTQTNCFVSSKKPRSLYRVKAFGSSEEESSSAFITTSLLMTTGRECTDKFLMLRRKMGHPGNAARHTKGVLAGST